MDLNKLAEEVEAAGWHCDKPGAEKLIAAALARVQAETREECAQVAKEQARVYQECALATEAAGNNVSATNDLRKMAACHRVMDAIRALNNAQGVQG